MAWMLPPTDTDLDRLIASWREWQNMLYGNTWTLPPEMHRAQAESWARANVSTGDPRFD